MINTNSFTKKLNIAKKSLFSINIYEMIYSVLFGIMCVIDKHVIHEPVSRSTILTSYITEFGFLDLLYSFVYIILTYAVIAGIKFCVKKVKEVVKLKYEEKDEQVCKKVPSACDAVHIKRYDIFAWFIIVALIMLIWTPYFMSHWPGGVYNDTVDSINIALGKQEWSNQNTVLYALLWKLIFWIGSIANQGDYGGLKLMTLLQSLIMAGVGASFFVWLKRRRIRLPFIILGVAAFSIFPIFPYYGISLWKDTLFSVVMFLYTWFFYIMAESLALKKKEVLNKRSLIIYSVLSLLIIFGRGNGIFIFISVSIAVAFIIKKHVNKAAICKFIILAMSIFALSIIVQGPVYKALKVSEGGVAEKYGIPLQQTAYIISSGQEISEESWKVLEGILPRDGWINLYSPTVVDTIKFDPLFNKEFFSENKGEFLKVYMELLLKNPAKAFKGYLLATTGFWDVWKSSSSAYICTAHAWNSEYFMSDYFNMYTGMLLSDIVGPRWYISAGALAWSMLLSFVFSLKGIKSKKEIESNMGHIYYLLSIVPGLSLWLTLLLATPLAFSFRYAFSLLLCQPIYWMVIAKNIDTK